MRALPSLTFACAAAASLTLAGCGGGSAPRAAATPGASTAPPAAQATMAPGAAASTAAAAASTSAPATPTGPVTCTPAQLTLREASEQAATGHVQLVLAFTNTSTATCTLTGYPGLSLQDASGHPLPTNTQRGAGFSFPAAPVRTVTLTPHAEASFDVGYSQIPHGSDDVCSVASRLAVIPPNDRTPLLVQVDIRACQHGQLAESPVVAGAGGVQ